MSYSMLSLWSPILLILTASPATPFTVAPLVLFPVEQLKPQTASSRRKNNTDRLLMNVVRDGNTNSKKITRYGGKPTSDLPTCAPSTTTLDALILAAPEESTSFSETNYSKDFETETRHQQPTTKSYLDDGFVFGLEGSGLSRPKGKAASLVVEGDSLETKPHQVALVTATFINHAAIAAMAVSQLLDTNDGNVVDTALQAVAVVVTSWVLADFGSGVLHWSVDNYGNGRTPIMGGVIAAFQGHHSAPWTITQRGFFNNVYKLCFAFGIPTVGIVSLLAGPSHPIVTLFCTVFCVMEILSQELHKWAHTTKSEAGPFVNWLQQSGVSIGRKPHALHHLAPYEGNYCIISGLCNDALDKSGFFRRLEHAIYILNGVESNAWKLDPELRTRTLRGDYDLM